MFFGKKNQEDLFRKLEEQAQLLEQRITTKNRQLLEGIDQSIGQLQTAVQKHDMAIEDLLDEWEEKQSDEEGVKKHFREAEQTQEQLLRLFEAYQEQFWNLRRFADIKDAAWAEQIAFMEQHLEHCRKLCGISIIGETGAEVDYSMHEVVEAVDTADPAQDKTVAEVYRCGYIYNGKIRKKAQVAAYRTGNDYQKKG